MPPPGPILGQKRLFIRPLRILGEGIVHWGNGVRGQGGGEMVGGGTGLFKRAEGGVAYSFRFEIQSALVKHASKPKFKYECSFHSTRQLIHSYARRWDREWKTHRDPPWQATMLLRAGRRWLLLVPGEAGGATDGGWLHCVGHAVRRGIKPATVSGR